MRKALIVFAKKPETGKVKTRLVPPLSYEEAKELYLCFIKDSLIQYWRLSKELYFDIFLAVTPEGSFGDFEDLIRGISEEMDIKPEINLLTQSGQDLGSRMFHAFTSVMSAKYDEAVVIGTDHPTLPDDYLRQSFSALDQETLDAVIGPAEDGGFYLLGLKRVQLDYFNDIPWSTGKVLDHTLKKFTEKRISFHLLPKWYDVDDRSSLSKMINDLSQLERDNRPYYSQQYLQALKNIEV